MIEIKMDEAGYEVYYSLDEAVKAFSHNIALENATLDLDIGLMLESDVDPFSNYGMEAISDRVKEMTSKAKSNFVLYAKKLINLLFGWLIKFFQGVVNIKKSMSSNYAKAKKYVEALNKYESQARQSSEKTVEITNAGNIVVYGLTVIQLISATIGLLGGVMKFSREEVDSQKGTVSATKIGENLTEGFTDILSAIYNSIGQVSTNVNNLEKDIKSVNYVISDLIKTYGKNSQNYIAETNADRMKAKAKDGNVENLSNKDAQDAVAEGEAERKSQFKQKIEQAQKYITTPEKEEMKCPQAWEYLKTQLTMFMGISKANKWDVEKNVKACENARRAFMKVMDKMSVAEQDDAEVKKSLAKVVEIGNMTAAMQNASGSIIKSVNKALDMMMTDVTKLGSILTTIGGGPAKDKDAEE